MFVHVMLDLETWGTKPGSALRSVGAVTFDPHGDERFAEQSYYANISRESCEEAGLTVDQQTVEWWSRQSREAENALLKEPKPLINAVAEFFAWWNWQNAVYVWSNGANFDEVLWRAASEAVGRTVPWKYWNVRDTRTIWHAAGINPKMIPRAGIVHNALADARYQAHCVTRAYTALGLAAAAALARTADTEVA